MNSRPMLFKGPMIRGLLRTENPKTQTRRILDVSHIKHHISWIGLDDNVWMAQNVSAAILDCPAEINDETAMRCPYGAIGDQIWVKETFSTDFKDHYPYDSIWYYADDSRESSIEHRKGVQGIWSPESKKFVPFKWKPSIFMPRWASRITLEITAIRAERLQDISEEDAMAEGLDRSRSLADPRKFVWCDYGMAHYDPFEWFSNPIDSYRTLWNSISLKPKPIYSREEIEPIRDATGLDALQVTTTGKNKIIGYESYPWSEADFDAAYPKVREKGKYRGKPLTVIANPWVWAISFKKL